MLRFAYLAQSLFLLDWLLLVKLIVEIKIKCNYLMIIFKVDLYISLDEEC